MYSDFDHGPVGPLEIHLESEGPDTAVFLAGDLDLCSRRSFWEVFSAAADRGLGRLIVDLSQVEFLDASGLRTLLEAHELVGDRLVIRTPSEAVRRVLELTGFDCRLPVQLGAGKLEYVRSLWEAFLDGGAPAMAELVPDQVEWMPLGPGGRILRGTREMREFWAGRPYPPPHSVEFSELGDDVLVHVESSPPGGIEEPSDAWAVYHFEGDRLTQAISFADRAQAVSFAV